MSEFILEEALERVKNKTTKIYLQEVVSSYNNKNYRASVSVLYTILIYDLLQKVIILKEVYGDESADNILTNIHASQKNNPKDPGWEGSLIDDICTYTSLITPAEKEELLYIKQTRNLAAHPIININEFNEETFAEELKLKIITKETSIDLIRKAFEIVFLRDAILAKNILQDIIGDIKTFYDRVKDNGLEIYLNSKYFSRMSQNRKNELFKALWKFVFILDNDDCIENRVSNFYGLLFLYKENKHHYLKLMGNNEDYYFTKLQSETLKSYCENFNIEVNDFSISSFKKRSRIVYFISFLKQNPEVYNKLNKYAKNIINSSINSLYIDVDVVTSTLYECEEKNKNIFKKQLETKAEAVFLAEDVSSHFNDVFKMIKNFCTNTKSKDSLDGGNYCALNEKNLSIILEQCQYRGCTKEFLSFIIRYCTSAQNFYQVHYLFEYAKYYFKYFAKNTFYEFLAKMNNNSQFYQNYEKNNMLKELEENFKQNFNTDLVSTIEEKHLYNQLYGSQLNNSCSVFKILDLLEERCSHFEAYELEHKILELLNCSQNSLKSNDKNNQNYENIMKVLREHNPSFADKFHDHFK